MNPIIIFEQSKGVAPPKLYNTHLQVLSPFHKKPIGELDPSFNFIKAKSEFYDKTKTSSNQPRR